MVETKEKIVRIGDFEIFVYPERYGPKMTEVLTAGHYEGRERRLASELLERGDRVLEIGTAVGAVTMTAAKIVGSAAIKTFDANPHIIADANRNFERNAFDMRGNHGFLKNRKAWDVDHEEVEFHIARNFWASSVKKADDQIETVKTPVRCLEDEIWSHRATALICDIEGAEADLLMDADLTGIRKLIIEVHYWAAGREAIDNMVRKLTISDFNVDLRWSGQGVLYMRR